MGNRKRNLHLHVMVTAEELEQFTAYLTDARHQLEQKPLYLRLVYMYLYAVI